MLRGILGMLPSYARIAWWGLVSPRVGEREPLVVHQAVVRDGPRLLLGMRGDLWGWELPGGAALAGEPGEEAVRRELREETGLEVEVLGRVGDYRRSGFRPHTARVYRCRPRGGALCPGPETRRVAWFQADALPETLFPWYRAPIADALAASSGSAGPVERSERLGLAAIWAGMRIDLRSRLQGGS